MIINHTFSLRDYILRVEKDFVESSNYTFLTFFKKIN